MTAAERRRQQNADLVARMKAGDDLNAFDSAESFFPVRPPIKKDAREMARIYGDEVKP